MRMIAIRIGPFLFSPPILAALVALILISTFIGLGRWQLDRMAERQVLDELNLARSTEAPISFPSTIDQPESLRYVKVVATGNWLGDRQLLLDNQVRDKKAGYSIITPFQLNDGRTVLVDRGWLPQVDGRRDTLPDIALPATALPQQIQGEVYALFPSDIEADERWFESRWPALIPEINFPVISKMLSSAIEPVVIRLDPSQPNGYLRQWPEIAMSSQKHLGYAVQWFALALTIFILLIVLNTKRVQ